MLFGIVGKPGSREFRTEITRYFASLKVMCARQHEVELCCFQWVGLKCQCSMGYRFPAEAIRERFVLCNRVRYFL